MSEIRTSQEALLTKRATLFFENCEMFNPNNLVNPAYPVEIRRNVLRKMLIVGIELQYLIADILNHILTYREQFHVQEYGYWKRTARRLISLSAKCGSSIDVP